ncbi:MAG: glycoside hydrolase family 104 protein [Gemmatimonadetes bacterium]|nr:glycoside hydrolase family 104 protein [Gemmatimonadota bacterium]
MRAPLPALPLAILAALATSFAANVASAAPRTTTDLLALVRALEAPRGYDDYERRIRLAPPRPLTAMTIGEVLSWQSRVRDAGAPSTAAGGYQVIRATLARLVRQHRLDPGAMFDPAMQDRLARLLVAECGDPGPPLRHPAYGNCLAGIWAALPLTAGPRKGQSAYRGVAGNRALTRPETVLAVLAGQPVSLPERTGDGRLPAPADDAVLAFGAVRLRLVRSAMRGAALAGTLTPSIRDWSFDPYAVD